MEYEELKQLVKSGEFHKIPKDCLTHNTLSQKDEDGRNLSMIAIERKQLASAPKEFLTKELILDTDNRRRNCLHIAAFQTSLSTIPKEFLKEEYLSIPDTFGQSTYHAAAGCWDLKSIPTTELNENVILSKDKQGQSVLDSAFYTLGVGRVEESPVLLKILSDKTLERLDQEYSKAKPQVSHGNRVMLVANEMSKRIKLNELKGKVKKGVLQQSGEEIEI